MPKPLTVWMTKHWKILKEMGIPDQLTCLLRNLYAGQEATVRTGHGKTDWFQIGKGVCQGYILSPCLFNLYAEYIMRNAGLDELQAGIKIARRNINNLRYADDTTLGRQQRTKEPLDESERGEWKSWLKAGFNIQKAKVMASSPITSWQIGGKNGNSERLYYYFLAPNSLQMVTSHEIIRHLLLGRKVITNLDSILKSRDIVLPTKVHLVKVMVFPVVVYGYKSWTIKKAEHWRIDAFELWC